jgi:hypothetical protein
VATIFVFLSRVNSPLVRLTETGRGMMLMSGDWEKATGESITQIIKTRNISLISYRLERTHPCVQDRAGDLNIQKYKAVNALSRDYLQYTLLAGKNASLNSLVHEAFRASRCLVMSFSAWLRLKFNYYLACFFVLIRVDS